MGQSKRLPLTSITAQHERLRAGKEDVDHTATVEETNNNRVAAKVIDDIDADITTGTSPSSASTTASAAMHTPKIRWPDFLVQIFLHMGAVYGLGLLFSVRWMTLLWSK